MNICATPIFHVVRYRNNIKRLIEKSEIYLLISLYMMEKTYKYGIIKENSEIVLFNNSEQEGKVRTSDFLVDVKVEIDDRGILDIKGNRIVYDFYYRNYRIFEDSWKHTPHPKEIHTGKRYFWSRSKERFVYRGFVRTLEVEPIHYLFSNFKIEIYD